MSSFFKDEQPLPPEAEGPLLVNWHLLWGQRAQAESEGIGTLEPG